MALWTGQLASALGSSMSTLAFKLVTLAVTGSARTAGLVGGAGALGAFLVGPFTGVLADRVSRRRMIVVGNLVGAMLFGALAVAGLAHALAGPLLLVIALLSGMSSTVVSPALSAAVRTVVPGSQRAQASAYASGRAAAVSLVAPPAGGALIPLGYGIPFLADAVSYVVAAASVLLVRHPLTAPERARRPFWHEMGEGFAFLGRHTTLMAFLVRSATFNLGVSTATTATALRLADRGVPTAQIGMVDTIAAAGGPLGATIAVRVVNRVRTGVFSVVTSTVLGALFALTALSGSP